MRKGIRNSQGVWSRGMTPCRVADADRRDARPATMQLESSSLAASRFNLELCAASNIACLCCAACLPAMPPSHMRCYAIPAAVPSRRSTAQVRSTGYQRPGPPRSSVAWALCAICSSFARHRALPAPLHKNTASCTGRPAGLGGRGAPLRARSAPESQLGRCQRYQAAQPSCRRRRAAPTAPLRTYLAHCPLPPHSLLQMARVALALTLAACLAACASGELFSSVQSSSTRSTWWCCRGSCCF